VIIKSIDIEKFRAFENVSFNLGKRITAVAGRNATQKTTILGMIGQPFSITQKDNPMFGCKTIDGYDFKSQFSEKFKFSVKEQPGEHRWTLNLYDGIHNESYYKAETIVRDQKSKKLRIWNAEDRSRKAGTGFVQIPVYYLSLSRLYPIGEVSKTVPLDKNLLSKEEDEYCVQRYREILQIMDINGTSSMGVEFKNIKQKFAGVTDEKHDISTNSAGEGNISRIILAMRSFKRLKDNYGTNYKGGILLIDELDAAVYPYSQEMLVEYLFNAAKDFDVQVVFTTHSPIVLNSLMRLKHERQKKPSQDLYDASIIYLEPDDDGLIKASNINTIWELKKCVNNMNLTLIPDKFHVYFEDSVAASLGRYLLEKYNINSDDRFDFPEWSLGWTQYVTLLEKNAFNIRDSLIILDADVPYSKDYNKHNDILESSENVLYLPLSVEEDLYRLLRDKKNYKIFREKFLKNPNFIQDICFKGRPHDFEYYKKKHNSEFFKNWFKDVEETVNRKDLFDFWFYIDIKSAQKFIKDFCAAYNKLAKRLNFEPLQPPTKRTRKTIK
jgi:AAA15 family ATPase/GTPase